MILSKFLIKIFSQNAKFQSVKPKELFFYPSSALNFRLQVFTKLHDSISKNTKFSMQLRRGTSPQTSPCGRKRAVGADQIIPLNVEDGSMPLFTVSCCFVLITCPLPNIYNLATPLCNAHVCKVDIKMIIFCRTISPCFFVNIDYTRNDIENNLVLSFLQTSLLKNLTGGGVKKVQGTLKGGVKKVLGSLKRGVKKVSGIVTGGVKKVLTYQN